MYLYLNNTTPASQIKRLTFRSHRGFSPVTTPILCNSGNRFNGLLLRYTSEKAIG
jgi:hypothetical protein